MQYKFIPAVLVAFLFASNAYAVDVDPCPPGNLIICNLKIPLPGNKVGYKAIMTVPSPYEHEPFTVECTGSVDGSFGYTVPDSSKVSCTLATCPAYSVRVCGYDIPTPGGTVEGQVVQLDIPSAFVTPAALSRRPSVTAICSDIKGTPSYLVKDRGGSGCADFACPPADISVCNTVVNIPDYGENGGVKEIMLPSGGHFRVQCLARNDKQPAYEIIDQREVVCRP